MARTAKELAESLGVTECSVYNWEVRGIQPNNENQERLEVILLDNLNL